MTPPAVLVTILACLYLPVPPMMLFIHAVHRRFPRLGSRAYAAHVPVYFALVAGTAILHAQWTAFPAAWPVPVRAVGAAIIASGALLLLVTYREIDAWTAMALPQVTGRGADVLLDRGIYGRVRHPRYTTLLAGAAGNALLAGSPALFLAAGLTAALVPLLVRSEERELSARFGAAYHAYRQRVPALFPFRRPTRRLPDHP